MDRLFSRQASWGHFVIALGMLMNLNMRESMIARRCTRASCSICPSTVAARGPDDRQPAQ